MEAMSPDFGQATDPSLAGIPSRQPREIPCATSAEDLWFSELPEELERAKAMCSACPVVRACLDGALERREPWGVWGGQILRDGRVIAQKRGRGRPPKTEGRPAA